jgi:hypothetical protein
MLSNKDLAQLDKRGIGQEEFNHYLNLLKAGTEPAELVRPARVGDGILKLSKNEISELEKLWIKESPALKIEKFVPASGAATRMFKDFHAYLDRGEITPGVTLFFENLEDFAFYPDLGTERVPESREEKWALLNFLLGEAGWNWSNLPKGLLPFHRLNNRSLSPFEEHLREGAMTASGKKVRVHFTVSPRHKSLFEEQAEEIVPLLEKEYNLNFNITYSFQDPSTDTPALNDQDEPFRTEDGNLLFRPGGHGSLIRNLNKLESNIVFLKNIDNVGTGKYRELSAQWFRIFGALLIQARKELGKAEEKLRQSPDEANHQAACKALKRWGGADLCGVKIPGSCLNGLTARSESAAWSEMTVTRGGAPFGLLTDGANVLFR